MRIIIRHGFNYLTLLAKTFKPFPKSLNEIIWICCTAQHNAQAHSWNRFVGHEIGDTLSRMKCRKEPKADYSKTTNKLKRKRQNRLTTSDHNEVMCFRSVICKWSDHALCVCSSEKREIILWNVCVLVHANAKLTRVDTSVYQTVFHICTSFLHTQIIAP